MSGTPAPLIYAARSTPLRTATPQSQRTAEFAWQVH
jgi:hypothetical protein